ncbi:ferredoxin [Homoserinimonas sp. A520]|jgi:ferredoxin
MKVILDQVKCVSGGQCVFAAPEVFDQREEDGVAFLLMEDIPEHLQAGVREAADVCPALAITFTED